MSRKVKKLLQQNKGFSAFFLVVIIAMAVFLAGTFESLTTQNATQVIPDPNSTFLDPTGKESLQLKTLGFVTTTPIPTITQGPINNVNCQDAFNTEPQILVGSDPAPGGTATGGQLRVWVNDEAPPHVAPGTTIDATGSVTSLGSATTAKDNGTDGNGKYLWMPALYLTTLQTATQAGPYTGDAESGGTPYFPTAIKGVYATDTSGNRLKGTPINGPAIDSDYVKFENGPQYAGKPAITNLPEEYTAEFIWNIPSLNLPQGIYHVEEVLHDGDINVAVNCVELSL